MARPARPGLLYLVGGFLLLIAIGTILLLLPVSTRDGGETGVITALFTATSAVCVTGLVLVDTSDHWTPFGQAVILALIQLGGLGFMTSSTLLLLILGRRLSMRQRLVTGETIAHLGGIRLTALIRRIVVVTLLTELAGAVILGVLISNRDGFGLQSIWRGMFTAISAFNNAGFDLEGGFRSLTGFAGEPLILGSVAALATAGAIGYAVWWDVVSTRRWHALALNTKVVVVTAGTLLVLGALVIFFAGTRPGGGLEDLGVTEAAMHAALESTFARTSGFSGVDVADFGGPLLFFIAGLMFVGGAPASTASGIKVTTFSVLGFAILSSLRGDEHVTIFEREIPWRHINRAISVALLSVAVVFILAFGLSLTTREPFIEILFEATSAFANVGLSTGVTRDVNEIGRLLLTVGMFIGRLGPLTLALALAERIERRQRLRYPEENLAIG